MPLLSELLVSPVLIPLLGLVSCPQASPPVKGISLAEDLGRLERVSEHHVVLPTRSVSAEVSSERFDAALVAAGRRNVAAIVLRSHDVPSLTSMTIATAKRAGMAILEMEDDADLVELILAIGRELTGEADVALIRASTAVRSIEVHPMNGTMESLLTHAEGVLGVPLAIVDAEPPGAHGRPIVIDDHVEGWVTADPQEGGLALATEIVLHAVAASAADSIRRARRIEELPGESRDEVLTDFFSASPEERPAVASRARRLGMPIDGWHVVVRVDFEKLAGARPGFELDAYESRIRFGAAVLRAARARGGTWHYARAREAVVLVKTTTNDLGSKETGEVARVIDEALSAAQARMPTAVVRCGIGMASAGPSGLLSSFAEAKAAVLAARTSKRANVAVTFDTVGLRRALVEWYASDTAREAAASVLQPLIDLGARGERLLQTLHVYLDERGSITRTAQRVHLHRNAVSYRINKAFKLLEIDRNNPDELLLLQLACRARELV